MSTQARKDAKNASTQTHQARDLADSVLPELTFAMSWNQLRKHKLTVFILCSFTFCFFLGAIFLLPKMEVHASVANIYNLPKKGVKYVQSKQ